MKKGIKGFAIFLCVGGCFAWGQQFFINKSPIYLVGILLLIFCAFFLIKNFNKVGVPKVQKEAFILDNELRKNNFIVSKELKLNFQKFLVDDKNKKFAINIGKSFKIYPYTDLIDFELTEDGNSITKGKGLATAVGGMTFGLVGAVVGASGKRKNQSTCTSMIVRIRINNLEDPQIVIPLINAETKKDSIIYRSNWEIANNLISILSYIENQNKQIKNPPSMLEHQRGIYY